MAILRSRAVHPARPRRQHRSAHANGLQHLLADSFQAYRDTHLAHFNVVGPSFPQLHALFEEQYNEQWVALDEIAERIRALGEPVADKAFSAMAGPLPTRADELVRHLARLNQRVVTTCRAVESAAEDVSDSATVDLAVQRMQAHQKHAWMLEATAEERPSRATPSSRRRIRPR